MSDKFIEAHSLPKVSIIVPVYNVEDYIEKCLESLVNQTLKEIEIIVVNDGSTDSSLEKIEKFAQKDKRITVINQENQGQGTARNTGLNIAKGKYIGFVDSDDYVDLDFYEKLYSAAKTNNADISAASILKHKKYKSFNLLYKKQICANTTQNKIKVSQDKKGRFFYVWNRLYKTEFLKSQNLIFPSGVYYEDVMFSAKAILAANMVICISNTYYRYVERKTSTVKSKENQSKKISDSIKVREELQEFAKEKGFKLPESLNYSTKKWMIKPLIKYHKGKYKEKLTLFGIIPLWIKKINN